MTLAIQINDGPTKSYYHKNRARILGQKSQYRRENRGAIRSHGKFYHHGHKLLVLSHYGGCCAVCGITDPNLLTIDHINNDGAEHKRKIGGSSRLYRWLIHNNFPSGFQVLCWNHNWLKRVHSISRSGSKASGYCHDYRARLRHIIINHYGGKCACCGETNIDLLTIDHMNGGGKKHLKEIGNCNFYRWLRDNGFPTGFRVLCFNCNCGVQHEQ